MLEPHGLRDSLYAYFIEHHFEMLWCHLLWFLYGQSWQTLHYTLYNTLICDMYHSLHDKSDTLLDKIEKPKKLISFCWGSKNSCPLVKVLEWMFYGLLGNIGQYWKAGNLGLRMEGNTDGNKSPFNAGRSEVQVLYWQREVLNLNFVFQKYFTNWQMSLCQIQFT